MNTATKIFIGIDVSKPHFDVSLMKIINYQKRPIQSARFDNTDEGLEVFEKWLTVQQPTLDENVLLVIENTGIYHRLLWRFCSHHNLPLHIKDLVTSRRWLLAQLTSNKNYLKALKKMSDPLVQKHLETAHQAAIKGLETSIGNLEKMIEKTIADTPAFKTNHDLQCSVPGIGLVTAVYLIGYTNNFAGGNTGKQLACYAGVAPFDHSSGVSIKGKNQMHKMANKDLKKLLHLCAMSAIHHCPELKAYYERKKVAGKHRMSILNAVRNKIVLRTVAVINKQKKYEDYTKMAA